MTEAVASAGHFDGADARTVAGLAERMQPVRFARDVAIFAEGEPGNRIYIVASGKVKICCGNHDGRQNILAIMGPSDMFGELSIFDPGPRTSSAITLTEVRAVSTDRAVMRAWIDERPENAEHLLRLLARRLRRTNDNLTDLIVTDLGGRVAKQLLYLAQRFGTPKGHGVLVVHGLTQDEMAQLVGASREAVNRTFTDFARRGWIEVCYKSTLLCDVKRLARRARLPTTRAELFVPG